MVSQASLHKGNEKTPNVPSSPWLNPFQTTLVLKVGT